MPELALNDDERNALVRHLDRVRVPQLMWREPPPHASRTRDASELLARRGLLPMPTRGWTVDDAQQRANRKPTPKLHPGHQLRPGPAIHADFATPAALAVANENRAARAVEIGLGEVESLTDPQAGPPEDDDQRSQTRPVRAIPCGTHYGDDLLDGGRVGRVAQALVPRRPTLVKARHRGRRPALPSSVVQDRFHRALLTER